MILDSTTRKYQVVLTAAKTTSDMPVVVNWEPISKMPNLMPQLARTSTNGVTAVDILATTDLPKRITSLTIYNADTAPKTVQVFLSDTGTSFLIVNITLQPGETLGYSEATQWYTGGQIGPFALLNGNSLETFSVGTATESTHALQASQKPGFPINYNGNMQVAQAGTSFAAAANNTYDLDGWLNGNSSAAVFTVAQAAGSVAGKYARQVTITTADASIAAGDVVEDTYRIEGYAAAILVGKDFTVSFSAKFPVTGIHCIALKNSGVDRTYVHEVNCLVADTWAEYSFTVTSGLPTAGTWDYTNGIGLTIQLIHMAGSTFTGTHATADTWMTGNYKTTANQVNDCATVGNVWALEDFRIDLGTVKGTEWPSYGESLARCKRYYMRVAGSGTNFFYSGYQAAGSYGYVKNEELFSPMRAVPTATLYGTWTVTNCSQPQFGYVTASHYEVRVTVTALGQWSIQSAADSSTYIELASRL